MTYLLMRTRLMLAFGSLLALALVAALAAAALSANAQDDTPTAPTFLIGGPTEGNSFPDDFRVQYRLKFGEADGGELGMRRTHVANVHDANQVRMVRMDLATGATVPWHTHPGPLIVAIAEGALTVTWSEDCDPRTYHAGESFVDLGQQVHMAENHYGGTTVVYIVGIGIPDGVPITNEAEGEFC